MFLGLEFMLEHVFVVLFTAGFGGVFLAFRWTLPQPLPEREGGAVALLMHITLMYFPHFDVLSPL